MTIRHRYNKLISSQCIFCVIVLCLIMGSGVIYCQEFNRDFGEIDRAQLVLKSDSLYPEASAAILFDYGKATISSMERHVGLKVYKKEGIKWAKIVIPDWNEFGNRDILKKVKAVCYNLDNNKIVTTKLDAEGIIRFDNSNDIEIQLKDVKEGSIVEFQYEISTRVHEWYFQNLIPVHWSEFLIVNPKNYIYEIFVKGSVPFFIYNKDYHGFTRYVAKDVEPFILEEPITSILNHMAKVEYHLTKYLPNPNDTMNYTTTWYEVCQDLISSEKFGGCLDGGLYLNDVKNEILAKDSTEIGIMISAHEKIKELIKWNNESSIFTDFSLRNALRIGIGNSADINLNLIVLLRKLGFNANPVVLATKDRGYLSQTKPSISNLNYVIAAVTINYNLYLLDATNPFLVVDMLPLLAHNDKGMFINDKTSYWVEFDNQLSYKSFHMNTFELDSLGKFNGQVQSSREGYAAYEFRNEYTMLIEDSIDYKVFIENENPGMKLTSYTLENFDELYQPLKEVYEVEIINNTGNTNEMISFNPMFYNQLLTSPFKLESRSYPVEYSYKQDEFYILNLKIPNGYKVEHIPEDLLVTYPDNSAKFEFRTDILGTQVQITSHMQINKLTFQPDEYPDLKKFFDMIVGKHSETIEIVKVQ